MWIASSENKFYIEWTVPRVLKIFFLVIAEKNEASENSEPINSEIKLVPNAEGKWVYQVVRYIHSPALFIQRDNSLWNRKDVNRSLVVQKRLVLIENLILPIRQKVLLVHENDTNCLDFTDY